MAMGRALVTSGAIRRHHYEYTSRYNSANPDILLIIHDTQTDTQALLLVHHKIGRSHSVVRIHNQFVIREVETSSNFSKHLDTAADKPPGDQNRVPTRLTELYPAGGVVIEGSSWVIL